MRRPTTTAVAATAGVGAAAAFALNHLVESAVVPWAGLLCVVVLVVALARAIWTSPDA